MIGLYACGTDARRKTLSRLPTPNAFGIGYAIRNDMTIVRALAPIFVLLTSPHAIGIAAINPINPVSPVSPVSAVSAVNVVPVDREASAYWTRWRGPSGQGIVAGGAYPDTWSNTVNVKWKVDVPGRGHSSPIVWKDQIFLTTARDDGGAVSMLAFRRRDGRLL